MRDPHLCSWELESGTETQLLLENTYTDPRVTLILKLSIPWIPDQCFRLLNQPSAQYHIHIKSRGIIPTCFSKNILSPGNTCANVKKATNNEIIITKFHNI